MTPFGRVPLVVPSVRGTAESLSVITVSTDGSCLRNPGGAIGWAWANHDGSSASGGHASGTNQIAELMAVLEAIRSHPGDQPLVIQADSQYAIKCSSEWVAGWKRKGWRTAAGGPVQNLALIQSIEAAIADAARAGHVRLGARAPRRPVQRACRRARGHRRPRRARRRPGPGGRRGSLSRTSSSRS